MNMSEFELKRVDKYVGCLVEQERPPVSSRDELDYGYRITGTGFEIFEIRPLEPIEKCIDKFAVAKAVFNPSTRVWDLFWMSIDSKWHSYDVLAELNSVEDVLALIRDDAYGRFWGYGYIQ